MALFRVAVYNLMCVSVAYSDLKEIQKPFSLPFSTCFSNLCLVCYYFCREMSDFENSDSEAYYSDDSDAEVIPLMFFFVEYKYNLYLLVSFSSKQHSNEVN